ncbi:MAG: flap structure-specific endonuclease, partial [Ignisphaera sp.]
QLIKSHGSLEKALKFIPQAKFPEDPLKIREYFLNPITIDVGDIEWRKPSYTDVIKILVEEYEFSRDRVENALKRLEKAYKEHVKASTSSLDQWFKRH